MFKSTSSNRPCVCVCVCVCFPVCHIMQRVCDCQVCSSHAALALTHTQTHTHSHTHTPCFLSLLKEFQPSLLSSWEDSSFPYFRFPFLPCSLPFPSSPSFLSVCAEVTVVQVHVFPSWFDGHCPCCHQNKFFPYLLLFPSSCFILVREWGEPSFLPGWIISLSN